MGDAKGLPSRGHRLACLEHRACVGGQDETGGTGKDGRWAGIQSILKSLVGCAILNGFGFMVEF